MRVLVDIRHLNTPQPAGIGRYTTQLLEALFRVDQNHEYILFSTGLNQFVPSISKRPGVSSLHLRVPNKFLNLRTLFLQHPTINWQVREPVDLIFLPNLAITSLPKDIPSIMTVHDLSWHLYPEFYSAKMRLWHKATKPKRLFQTTKKIITPSESTKRDLHALYSVPTSNIHVIPHGVPPYFQPGMQASDHGVRSKLKLPRSFVLFVGTIEPRKNLLALIDGVKQYRARTNENLHLLLVGKWGWKSNVIRRRLWKQDVKPWVHHIGYTNSTQLPAIYRSAKATLFPSIYEGFGLPILESLACGTPVITSYTSSMPEVGEQAAIYIDPYNSRDICEALKGLLHSTSLQKQLREQGIEQAKRYSWNKTATQTLELFEQTQN